MSSSRPFIVTFEHARRAFKCVRLDWRASDAGQAAQWVVTLAGRPVWSFAARDGDTSERVREEVVAWWDEAGDQRHAPPPAPGQAGTPAVEPRGLDTIEA